MFLHSGYGLAKAIGLALLLTLLIGTAVSAEVPAWEPAVFEDFPVRILLDSPSQLADLLREVPLSSYNREQVNVVSSGPFAPGLSFEPRISEDEARLLEQAGWFYERIPDLEKQSRRAMERAWADQERRGGRVSRLGERGVYHNHAQVGQILQQTETDHPEIADYFSLGNSVQGRQLWMLRISDNVDEEEAEPEVRLSSTMHGNEPPGLEMLLYLVDYLTDQYGSDPDVTYLVDNYELHILPLHNPDGHAVGSRYNANGVDLNRNFPVPDGSIGEDGTYSEEIETVLFKNYGFSHDFVISENGHSGALVVNYPWDYTYDLTPDNDAIILLSEEYSYYNSPMWNGNWWHGITNGAQWYVVHGSLQDWSYEETGCIDVTIEYSDNYAPPASQLETYWNNNRESFMHWIKAARYGVNGVVTDADTGQPLAATVTVSGNAKSVTTDPDFGDYYKLLDDGTWNISFSASGYITQTVYGVSTSWGTPTVLNVQLLPEASCLVSGQVIGAGQPLTASIEVRAWPADTYVTSTNSDAGSGGAYSLDLVYGDYKFIVSADGFLPDERLVTLDSETATENFYLLESQEYFLFSDDFESGDGQWDTTWGLTTSSAHSSSHSMTDSPSGDYGNNEFKTCTMAFTVNPSEVIDPQLSFWARWEIETNWDCVQFQLSTNGGGSWAAVSTAYTEAGSGQGEQPSGEPVFEGTQNSWVENTVDLGAWENETSLLCRFVLMTDGSVRKDGFYFDDFEIVGEIVTTSTEEPPLFTTALVGAWPNPFNPRTEIRYTLAEAGPVDLAIHDVSGRLVRRLASASLPAGEHDVVWNGRTEQGQAAASGLYFLRLTTASGNDRTKLLLMK